MNFIEELTWRNMIQDHTDGLDAELAKGMRVAYVGFDPTADSLHIGNMVPISLLRHFQRAGHKPIALVGGATGMVGDPSGKSAERNLLSEDALRHNQECIKKQLEKFLDFDCGPNSAEMVNNYDWFNGFGYLEFIRDVGKHITVNYMSAKDSVKNRLGREGSGMSYTEFSYQLIQGYDFYHLWKNHNCLLQMGGSDQWGNITTGLELIRRIGGHADDQHEAHALTARLLLKSDGTKFGKSESGNVWLDADKTSPFEMYQFWMNARDDEAEKSLLMFSERPREEIESIIAAHKENPGANGLQRALGEEFVRTVHGEEALQKALEATETLFSKKKSTIEILAEADEETLKAAMEGTARADVSREALQHGIDIVEFAATITELLPSKSEARRALKEGSLKVNEQKVDADFIVSTDGLINGKYILIQRGKKKKMLVTVV